MKIAIVGAGLSGLALANGLLQDRLQRFDVQLYERDTIAYDLERGGYQIRIGVTGLNALKTVSNEQTWKTLQRLWGGEVSKAPALVDPEKFWIYLNLAKLKVYPQSRPVPRTGLRHALLEQPHSQERIHFGHEFDHYELLAGKDSGVNVYFKNGVVVHADLLIAADGSGSRINQQAGIKNKVKLRGHTLIQARGTITDDVRARLPKSLLDCGSVLYLGGESITGFASVYNHEELLEPKTDVCQQEDRHTLFWSVHIPATKGQAILEKGKDDKQLILELLTDYVRNDLGLGDNLASVYASAPGNLRSGLVTSSFRPTFDWRAGCGANSRIILIGDALHPMTPGRGQGANQALTDAAQLSETLRSATFYDRVPNDRELSSLIQPFEREMYDRAFSMVKKSEDLTSLDLRSTSGKAKLLVAKCVLAGVGWIISTLEWLTLKKPEVLDFEYAQHM
jgi:2-polyprenyl-6-methoxyphenol hydroxylase-like FAD-dependent oxidoreductase